MAAESEKPRGKEEFPTREKAPTIDLRQQTYDLLSQVREPSVDEKEALKGKGIVFLPIAVKSYAQVVDEDPGHFLERELTIAMSRQSLRDYMPPVAMSFGLNPETLALPDSFNKSQADQLQMIDDYSQTLQAEFPDARAVMLPVTAYVQADRAHKETTGEVLFSSYFARALDMVSEVEVAFVGRFDPSHGLLAFYCNAHDGAPILGAVPAVVFVGNK